MNPAVLGELNTHVWIHSKITPFFMLIHIKYDFIFDGSSFPNLLFKYKGCQGNKRKVSSYCGLRKTEVHKKRGGAQDNYEGINCTYILTISIYNIG